MRKIVLCVAILLSTVGCAKKDVEIERLWSICQGRGSYSETTYACDTMLEENLTRENRGLVHTRLCWIYLKNSRWVEALEACKRGNDPLTYYINYNNIGVAEMMTGNPEHALVNFKQAIDDAPRFYPDAHYNRGLAFEMRKNRKAAIAEFTLASKGCGMYLARWHVKALLRFKKL